MDGTTLAVEPADLVGSLFALIPIPVAIIDSQGQVVMSNSTFNDFFPNIGNVNRIPRHEVSVNGTSTFDFESVPLTDQGLSIFFGREITNEVELRHQLVHM